ncbi:amino acid/amide ABC transporter substrate-binding protein, HAAT family [Thermanaeromonas toyohensis ToBE]|uniref:Amino acid/amide ABC transporter substrate-binding protein, HAAT family n=1 Tax=Thermanaeromonas toyohensis ToBE TaxID=698762 RepID=A0A1W1W267_9FIRM|nr:substrate-binding domain-containing protein [Thermanaeromonas toyohensis]SMB99194.1 amino acid/amide ABC transporter substrate-binding protein, HAAT family [Thermanaeromonas toyohensis ToBE]
MKRRSAVIVALCLLLSLFIVACSSKDNKSKTGAEEKKTPIKIGILASLSGALESYGKDTVTGFELGLEYATKGTKEVAGRRIEVIAEDTTTKPDVAKQKALKLLEQDKVDILVGCSSSADALAVLPLAQEYKRIMVVEPAVADSITGAQWNKYIFRTARNSSQDALAVASAIASAKPGATVAILAQDYSFGREGAAAFVKLGEPKGLKVILQEFAPMNATDFTAHIQRIINAKPDYLFVIWAGSANTPWKQIQDMKVAEKGIRIITGTPEIAAMKAMWGMVGQEGYSVYYHGLPKNPVNDWLVEEHKKRYNRPPDLFTPGGFAAAVAIVRALEKTGGDTNAEKLIEVMEGMSFETPKGTMTFRKEDHQALQTLYHIRFEKKEGFDYPVPVLIREIKPEETAPPIMNKR